MKKQTTLCMGCMTESGDALTCAACGYTESGVFLASYLAPGTFLAGRYIAGKLISYNGEGALYIAFDTVENVRVTIREYMPDTLCGRKKNEEAIEVNTQYVALYKTYLSEFIELNRLLMNTDKGLQIQRVLDVFNENNTAYAVYEYIAGISLKSYLINLGGKLPWEQVRELFTPLFTTLNLLHADGIIHRGLSPSTIILNEKSEMILVDFGITAARTNDTEINHEIYLGYAAPEQYSSAARHGAHTDVYGISAVLYKVLTGQMPPDAAKRGPDADVTEPMLINRNIPPSVSSAIVKGLAYSTEERTRTVNAFISGIFEASAVTVPDSTGEIFIRKPPRLASEDSIYDDNRKARISRANGKNNNKNVSTGSRAAAVTVCVMLGLVLAAFIMVILFSEELNERFKDRVGDTSASDDGTLVPVNNVATATTPADAGFADTSANTGINPNEPLYVISDFTSRRLEQVENNNTFAFLNFIATYEFSDEYAEGIIFGQDKPQGTEVAGGTDLNVKVSKGPKSVALPEFEGVLLADYTNILGAAKIKYDATGEYHDVIQKDMVISCYIGDRELSAGDIINFDTDEPVTVMIYYSLGENTALSSNRRRG